MSTSIVKTPDYVVISQARARIRSLIASVERQGEGTSTMTDMGEDVTSPPPSRGGKVPEYLAVGSKRKAWNSVYRLLKNLETRMSFIEGPIKQSISVADTAAKKLNDPTLSKKVRVKFNRIFGSILSPLEMSRSYLTPLLSRIEEINSKIREETSKIHGYKASLATEIRAEEKGENDRVELDKLNRQLSYLDGREAEISASKEEAKDVFDGVSSVSKAIKAGLKSLDPSAYLEGLIAEIKKQKISIVNMDKTLATVRNTKGGKSSPELVQRFSDAVQMARAYVEGLEAIASPEFVDRVENNVSRAVDEDIPGLMDAIHALGLAHGASHGKKGSVLTKITSVASRSSSRNSVQSIFSKKINRVAKRDALLMYL